MSKLSVTERYWRVLSSVLWIAVATCVVLGLSAGTALAQDNHKLEICHNGTTISVDYHAIPAHLEHGDFLVECGGLPLCGCGQNFDPVFCGGRVWANRCLAACAGFPDCDVRLGVCSQIYDPVSCTLPDGSVRTFANECLARNAGCTAVSILCPCPQIYAPVRCGNGTIYINACVAQCQGASGCTPLSTNPLQNSLQGQQKIEE